MFDKIKAKLGWTAIESVDGQVSFSEEDLQTIEAALPDATDDPEPDPEDESTEDPVLKAIAGLTTQMNSGFTEVKASIQTNTEKIEAQEKNIKTIGAKDGGKPSKPKAKGDKSDPIDEDDFTDEPWNAPDSSTAGMLGKAEAGEDLPE